MMSAERPSDLSCSTTFVPLDRVRDPMITWYLWSRARMVAAARPIPWLAPVIKTIVLLGVDILAQEARGKKLMGLE